MTICFINDIGILGGGEIWVVKTCQELVKLGHRVMVVCPWRSQLNEACLKHKVKVFTYLQMEGIPAYEPVYYFLKRNGVDVVYCTVMGNFCEAEIFGTMVNKINQERRHNPAVLILKTGLPPMIGLSPAHYGLTPRP